MDIDEYIKRGLASKINETELSRYTNFFDNTSKENLSHCKFVLKNFPRWSIISGYYAMHDATKLLLAKKFMIKIDFNVHKTTLAILKELIKDQEIRKLLKIGYDGFIEMANDLSEAKSERTKAQYYTGSEFMKERYQEKARQFLEKVVIPYLNKMTEMLR